MQGKMALLVPTLMVCLIGTSSAQVVTQIGKNHQQVKSLFRGVIAQANQSAVRVFSARSEQDVALGAIVSPQGHIVTIASHLHGDIHCLLTDGRHLLARIVGVSVDHNLALIRVQAMGLKPTRWSHRVIPPLGSLLATPGRGKDPVAIGIVSTPTRRLPLAGVPIGIRIQQTDAGPRIVRLIPESIADQAGLQTGDIVIHGDGQPIKSCATFVRAIHRTLPNKVLHLRVLRNAHAVDIIAHARPSSLRDSLRDTGENNFPLVIQHDTILRPNDCGGPIVDLDGQTVGINVARANRVTTYAVAATDVVTFLDDFNLSSQRSAGAAPAAQDDLSQTASSQLTDLRKMEAKVRQIAHQTIVCTVGIQLGPAMGSGVIVSDDGYVMTAAHVAQQPGRTVKIILSDGRVVEGKTLGVHRDIDAGVIKIQREGRWPFVKPTKKSTPKAGQWCVATGHSLGYQHGRGAVVRLGRILKSLPLSIRTDCTLIGGDSGGPLFDLDGRLIGIHSQIGRSLAGNIHVPIPLFLQRWDQLFKADASTQEKHPTPARSGPT